MRGITAGEHFAVEQQDVARLPRGDFFLGQCVEVDALGLLGVRRPGNIRPVFQFWGRQMGGARAIQVEVHVTGCRAVGNHGDW